MKAGKAVSFPGASERSRGQAKVKPEAPGLEGGRRSRQSWGQGALQHKSLRWLLASSPRRQVSLRKGIRDLPEIFRHGLVAQDLSVCGKMQLKSCYCPEKIPYCQAPDACGVTWAHREGSSDAGHLTQHGQTGFPTSKWARCRNHRHLCSQYP